jgi:hypothetical protein
MDLKIHILKVKAWEEKHNKPHYVVAFAHLESVQRHVDQTPVRASPAFAKSSRSQSMQVDRPSGM